jgi:hypothetical protein
MAALTHAQKVTRLYRKSLKHMLSWTVDRGLWRRQAVELRNRFDAYKGVNDMNKALKLLQEGEEEFNYLKHPDPYISEISLIKLDQLKRVVYFNVKVVCVSNTVYVEKISQISSFVAFVCWLVASGVSNLQNSLTKFKFFCNHEFFYHKIFCI